MKQQRSSGFSLVELMIGLTLGLIVLGGVVAMFLTSSATAANQQRIAQVLESGRYGAQMLMDELRRTGAQYCSSYAEELPTSGGVNKLRSPIVHANEISAPTPNSETWMTRNGVRVPNMTYLLDPARFVRGHECATDGSCFPALPSATDDVHSVPSLGVAERNRVPGTDVLTIRYLATDGLFIDKNVTGLNPVELPAGSPSSYFEDRDLVLLASCGSAEIFRADVNGRFLLHSTADDFNYDGIINGAYSVGEDARVFNFSRDFRTVTYYVGLQVDPTNSSAMISSLYRIESGATAGRLEGGLPREPEVVVEGVERFDVTFLVVDGQNRTRYLNAAQVDAGGADCAPVVADTIEFSRGCLWRGVQGADVSMLVASNTGSAGDEGFRYSPDGGAVQSYAAADVMPNGLPARHRLRREFRVFTGFRNLSR